MHDDQIRALLRTLEDTREPDPAFADGLFTRLTLMARADQRGRAPFLLLAAALVGLLAAGVALGSGLISLPLSLDASPTPVAPSPVVSSSASAVPSASMEPALAFEAPPDVLPPQATVILNETLELHDRPRVDSEVIATGQAGTTMRISGPLLVDGQRWYHLIPLEGDGGAGHVALDPTGDAVSLVPVECPSAAPTLATLTGMNAWERLACYGDQELTLEGSEIVGFGGYRPGTYEPEWLNGFLGAFAITSDGSEPFFVRVEPETVDTTRPSPTSDVGTVLLRITGHFNHPASTSCSSTSIPVSGDGSVTADYEPIAAQLECREQFVVTGFRVVDDSAVPTDLAGAVLSAAADGLRLRSTPSAEGEVVATLRLGQRMGLVSGPTVADGMGWYEVRIGPGDLRGWVAAGTDRDWLRLVDDGALTFRCDGCAEDSVLSVNPLGDDAITTLGGATLHDWTWSPDGARLAGTLDDGGVTPNGVVVMDSDGSNQRRLGDGFAPSWSPDGSRLAWTIGSALVVTDENLVPIELRLDIRSAGRPLWSPDGRRLTFTGLDCPACPPDEPIVGDPPSATYSVGVDGSGLRQLTSGDYSGVAAWAPDGSRLGLILHDLSGEFPTRGYTLAADGGEPTFLLDGSGVSSAPTWSPDGSRLAVTTSDGLVVMNGDGANPEIIATDSETGIWEAAWSPSGRYLVYTTGGSSAGTGLDLWIVPANGGAAPTRVSPEDAAAQMPAWQPRLLPLP